MDFPTASCTDHVHGEAPAPSHAVVVLSGVTKKPVYLRAHCRVIFVIKPMSVQHRFLWAFQHLPLKQVPMWRAVFPVTRPHVADIACSRPQTFRIKCLLQGSQYIPILFNNCESGQKRRWCSVLKPEHSAEIYQ